MERTASLRDRLLQAAHRRFVVAVLGETATGAVEDLAAAGRQMVLADSGHRTRSGLQHVAQHVLQDAAVAVVVRLAGGVDAHHGVELDLGAVRLWWR